MDPDITKNDERSSERHISFSIEDTLVGPAPVLNPPKQNQYPLLLAAQCSHVGNIKARNEDSTYALIAESGGQEPMLPFGLCIVADGMGAHQDGHKASKSAIQIVAKRVFEGIYLPKLHDRSSLSAAVQKPVRDVLVDAIHLANDHIYGDDPEKDSGTTVTTTLVFGRRLYLAHVGDSRAYLFSDGEINLLTTDHSYVRRLQEAGQLTEEEASVHPQRNLLYLAVGQGEGLQVDTFTQTLPQVGKLILCSDGLVGDDPTCILDQVV